MSRLLFGFAILVLFCPGFVGQSSGSKTKSVQATLIARAQEWVDTWNDKDVKRMRQLHAADISSQLYAIDGEFVTMKGLLDELAKEKFWNLSWSIKIADPRVRLLGSDSALVTFRLVGKETNSKGISRPYSAAFSMIFQRQKNVWKVVHVHDSSANQPS